MFKKILDYIRSLFFKKDLEISILGLQNAGKSTLVNTISSGQFDEDTIPTIGFNLRNIKKDSVQIKLWDLGGQPRFRESWEKYCRGADGILFVIDSSNQQQIEESKIQLLQLLQYPSVQGIPLLVLGNKNDIEGSLKEQQIIEALDLRSIKTNTIGCYSISAKNIINIDVTIKWLTNLQKRQK